tara:strand:+ start:3194 stop:3469 length:276 start_codon:yes stop_codon:yes gene_type:complete
MIIFNTLHQIFFYFILARILKRSKEQLRVKAGIRDLLNDIGKIIKTSSSIAVYRSTEKQRFFFLMLPIFSNSDFSKKNPISLYSKWGFKFF